MSKQEKLVIAGTSRSRSGEPILRRVNPLPFDGMTPPSRKGRSFPATHDFKPSKAVISPGLTVGSYWKNRYGIFYKVVEASEVKLSLAGVGSSLIVERLDGGERNKTPATQFLREFSFVHLVNDVDKAWGIEPSKSLV